MKLAIDWPRLTTSCNVLHIFNPRQMRPSWILHNRLNRPWHTMTIIVHWFLFSYSSLALGGFSWQSRGGSWHKIYAVGLQGQHSLIWISNKTNADTQRRPIQNSRYVIKGSLPYEIIMVFVSLLEKTPPCMWYLMGNLHSYTLQVISNVT